MRSSLRSPTRLDGGEQDAAAAPPGWKKEGNKGYPSDQIHCGGGARSGTRRGRGKIVASEDFASSLIYVLEISEESRLMWDVYIYIFIYIYIFKNNSW